MRRGGSMAECGRAYPWVGLLETSSHVGGQGDRPPDQRRPVLQCWRYRQTVLDMPDSSILTTSDEYPVVSLPVYRRVKT